MHLYITKTCIAANLWCICCGMCSFHFSANLSYISIICKSKVLWRKHIQILYRNVTAVCCCFNVFCFFYACIAIYVFSGHGVNPGSCTNDNINTTTVISHHPLPSSPARKVVIEQWGQFLVKDASVLDICHRHSTCSHLSSLCLPHFPHPLCKRCFSVGHFSWTLKVFASLLPLPPSHPPQKNQKICERCFSVGNLS